MAKTTRLRLTEVRVRIATAADAKHGRQLFDGLGSNGLYLHVTPAGAKCWMQQHMVPNAATGKSRRVRIGLGAWPRVTLAQARNTAFANRCLRDKGRDPLASKRHRAHEAAKYGIGFWSQLSQSESGFLREGTRLRQAEGARQARAGKGRRACLGGPERSLASLRATSLHPARGR